MKTHKHTELLVVIVLTLLLFFFAFFSVIKGFMNVPDDRFYYGTTGYPLDFLHTLAVARNGENGMWQWYFDFQVLPFYRQSTSLWGISVLHAPYVLLGHMARILQIDLLVVMYVSRLVLSVVFFWLSYRVITHVFDRRFERVASYVFLLFSAPITFPGVVWESVPFLRVGDYAHVFHRFTAVSHHYLLGHIVSLIAILAFFAFMKNRRLWTWIVVSVSCFFVSYVNAPGGLYLLLTLIVSLVIVMVVHKNTRQYGTCYVGFGALISGVSFVGALIVYPDVMKYFWALQQITFVSLGFWEYILVVGGVVVFFVPGAFKALQTKKVPMLIVTAACISHIVLAITMEPLFGMSIKRMFQTPYLLYFSIVSVYGIVMLSHKAKRLLPTLRIRFVQYGCVIVVFLFGIVSYSYSYVDECFCAIRPFDIGYPKRETMEAISWLDDHVAHDAMVFSGIYTSTLISSFSGHTVFANQWGYLANSRHPVFLDVYSFLSGSMSEEDVRSFVLSYDISYVMVDEDEMQTHGLSTSTLPYGVLVPVYTSGHTVIYSVSK